MAGITADVGEVADMVEYDDFLLFCDRAVSPLNAGIGGTNVSSVSAIDTGSYAWVPSPPKRDVRLSGTGLILPRVFLETLGLRFLHSMTTPMMTSTRRISALNAITASMAGKNIPILFSTCATSSDSETVVEPSVELEAL